MKRKEKQKKRNSTEKKLGIFPWQIRTWSSQDSENEIKVQLHFSLFLWETTICAFFMCQRQFYQKCALCIVPYNRKWSHFNLLCVFTCQAQRTPPNRPMLCPWTRFHQLRPPPPTPTPPALMAPPPSTVSWSHSREKRAELQEGKGWNRTYCCWRISRRLRGARVQGRAGLFLADLLPLCRPWILLTVGCFLEL